MDASNTANVAGNARAKQIQFKLVLLGESAVGKSSVVMRFVKDRFDEYKESTIGAAFLSKVLTLENGSQVKFEIWDTAGQERYKSLAPMYYRNAQCAVVVYDITLSDSFERAKKWVEELRKQLGNNVLIALAGNKVDIEQRRVISVAEGKSYAEENGLVFYETSAKSSLNISELFYDLAKKLESAHTAKIASNAAASPNSTINLNQSQDGDNQPNCSC